MLIVNGKTSRTKPNRDLLINRHDRFDPPILNGFIPTDVVINGLNRPPVLSGCELYIPLYHPALRIENGVTFKSLDKNAHVCTTTGASWTPQGGKFDGIDDYISIPDAASLKQTVTKTIGAWIKLDALDSWQSIYTKGRWDAFAGTVTLYVSNANKGVLYYSNGTAGRSRPSTSTLTTGVWYHLFGVINADGSINIYLNGALDQDAGTGTITAPTDSTALSYIGANQDAPINKYRFTGTIGEVLIYNRVLSAAEIANYYLATQWRFR